MIKLKATLPFRTFRNRHDNAVWWWQQQRVRRAIDEAYGRPEALALDRDIALGGSWPTADDPRPLLLAACDEGYFGRFGVHLARSSAARSPATRLHLHLFEPSPDTIAVAAALVGELPDSVTISHEGPARNPFGAPKSFYFAAGRFAIGARLRRELTAPIMMIDADGLVARDLTAGFAALGDMKAGFIFQPDNAARYRRILASAVYLGPGSDEFFTRLADGIGLALRQRGHYHVDQLGIHYALRHPTPTIAPLGLEWSDYRFAPDSLIWSAKGARKEQYEALLAASAD